MPANPAPNAATAFDYRLIGAISLLLSIWLIAIDPVLDRDAILYLRSADAYLQEGLAASRQLYGRPLLSICLALLHQLTGVPLLYIGLALNALLYALLSVGFVATVGTLGGDRRVQVLAAIVILSHPVLNDQRSSILRDPAYWALIVLAFREILRYLQQPLLQHQLRWFAYIALASLFRFEGLFFAALAPLALLATRDLPRRLHHCLRLLAPQLVVLLALLVALLLARADLTAGVQLFPAIEYYLDRLFSLGPAFASLTEAAGDAMLEFSAREDAAVAVIAGLGAILALNICRALSWPWVILLWWGWRRQLLSRLRRDDAVVLWAHLLICLAYLALFTLINRFMLERYASQLALFALLYLPFILDRLWVAGARSLRRYLVIALLLAMAADSLHNLDYQKRFIADATDWLRENTDAQASLVANNQHLAYFSGRPFDWTSAAVNNFEWQQILAAPDQWQHGDYLAMRIRRRDTAAWELFLRDHQLRESAVFDGGRHGKVSIIALRPVAASDAGLP